MARLSAARNAREHCRHRGEQLSKDGKPWVHPCGCPSSEKVPVFACAIHEACMRLATSPPPGVTTCHHCKMPRRPRLIQLCCTRANLPYREASPLSRQVHRMIEFACPACSSPFKVPESAAGRRGKCTKCGQVVTVPEVPTPTEPFQLARPKPPQVETLKAAIEPPPRVEAVAANVPAPLNPEVVDPAPAAGNPFAAAPIQYVYVQAGASENTWGIIGLVVSMIGTLLTCGALSPVGLIISVAACFQKPRGAAIAGAVVGGVGSLWLATAGLSMILTFFSVQQAITGTAKSIEGTAKGVEGLTKSTEKLVDDASGVLKDPGKAVEDAKKSIDKAIGTQSKK